MRYYPISRREPSQKGNHLGKIPFHPPSKLSEQLMQVNPEFCTSINSDILLVNIISNVLTIAIYFCQNLEFYETLTNIWNSFSASIPIPTAFERTKQIILKPNIKKTYTAEPNLRCKFLLFCNILLHKRNIHLIHNALKFILSLQRFVKICFRRHSSWKQP